jgi:hypothetical protein
MTRQQERRINELEKEMKKRGNNMTPAWKESESHESHGVIFAALDGVTIVVAANGLVNIPAVRSYKGPQYPTPVIAAASAKELWAKQKARDDANHASARVRRTGHLGPLVDPDLKCRNKACPCQSEAFELRRRRAQGGFNANPDRCS